MSKTIEIFGSKAMLIVMLLWLSFYAAISFWPSSWWFEVRTVSVGPSHADKPVPMIVDRSIHRRFTASWYVTVRKWHENGWYDYCMANGISSYHTETRLPNDLTLDWWTNGTCPTLPAGRFAVDTTWVIHGFDLLPDRSTHAVSNIFEVKP